MLNPTTTRIKRQHERVIGSRLTIDLLNNFDQVWRRHFGKAANVGASLEDYVLLTVVLMGEAEGRLFSPQISGLPESAAQHSAAETRSP